MFINEQTKIHFRVADAVRALKQFKAPQIPVAAVATGFPSGQYSLKTRLEEITLAIESGATEIDIVINRELALKNDWQALYDEVKAMKATCGDRVHMKSILAIGELGSFSNIYKASLVCMMAGSDFIKTSTGKEGVNATLPVGLIMCRQVRIVTNFTAQIFLQFHEDESRINKAFNFIELFVTIMKELDMLLVSSQLVEYVLQKTHVLG